MKLSFTNRFVKAYKKLPRQIREATDKPLGLLLSAPNHPSLNMRKMQGVPDIWEARATKSYRFTFQLNEDVYTLRNIGAHDILEKP